MEKFQNFPFIWTDYTFTYNTTTTLLNGFQKWLGVQARTYDRVSQENRTNIFRQNVSSNYHVVIPSQTVQEQSKAACVT